MEIKEKKQLLSGGDEVNNFILAKKSNEFFFLLSLPYLNFVNEKKKSIKLSSINVAFGIDFFDLYILNNRSFAITDQ